tara:strand:- start:5025 stop:5852 length:828 start_codon:yes stop_codon:yes gene_type:complete
MLNRIILGTANFTQQYGVLSSKVLDREEVKKILEQAFQSGILTLDTAFGYGDMFHNFLSNVPKRFTINTKFSLKDDLKSVYENLKSLSRYKIDVLMVHDPQNIQKVKQKSVRDFFNRLKEENIIRRVGISVYDEDEVNQFATLVCKPDVIQIPLNPLNQIFNHRKFKQYVYENNIEIQARSLFLQGVLLSSELPGALSPLKETIETLRKNLGSYPSVLSGLCAWACQNEWVNKWVLGVSSTSDLDEICRSASGELKGTVLDLHASNHPLVDPRNW